MASLFKRSNGIYYAIVTDQTGRRRWISTRETTKGLALKRLSSILIEKGKNERRDEPAPQGIEYPSPVRTFDGPQILASPVSSPYQTPTGSPMLLPTLVRHSDGLYYVVLTDMSGVGRGVQTRPEPPFDQQSAATPPPITMHEERQKGISLRQFETEFMEYAIGVFRKENVGIYRRSLGRFIERMGSKDLDAITPQDVDMYKKLRITEVSPVTVNIELRSLRAAFYTALRWEKILKNPFKSVKLCRVDERIPAFLKAEEFRKLLSSIPEPWLREIVAVAAYTGMRRCELLNLRWCDIDFERKTICIESHEGFRTKSGKKRLIPMHENVAAVLRARKRIETSELIFTIDGDAISKHRLSMKFKRAVRRAGLGEKIHFHTLRHTFASWLVQESASLYEVQKLLGHSSIKVTEIYSHIAPETLHRTVSKLPTYSEQTEGGHNA